MDSSHREWLEDTHTRKMLDAIKLKRDMATRAVLISAGDEPLDKVRERAGYMRGLNEVWRMLKGKRDDESESE